MENAPYHGNPSFSEFVTVPGLQLETAKPVLGSGKALLDATGEFFPLSSKRSLKTFQFHLHLSHLADQFALSFLPIPAVEAHQFLMRA